MFMQVDEEIEKIIEEEGNTFFHLTAKQ